VTHEEFCRRTHLTREEVLAISYGRLVDDPPPTFTSRLPAPPMLMLDRVMDVERNGRRGRIVGERDIRLDDWFFACHFTADPVQPGCLGVDAIWQLIGLYCSLRGAMGTGRALGCREVEFFGQIRPHDKLVRYEVDIVRYQELPASGSTVAIGDAKVLVDGVEIYRIERAKVGVFLDIDYPDYPWPSERSRGGLMEEET
jgi:3-hydroxyacyl-[acyl-carrier protein] dehydratase / trans-2-decenoyl-[acyl-carrier protein] isomerase